MSVGGQSVEGAQKDTRDRLCRFLGAGPFLGKRKCEFKKAASGGTCVRGKAARVPRESATWAGVSGAVPSILPGCVRAEAPTSLRSSSSDPSTPPLTDALGFPRPPASRG